MNDGDGEKVTRLVQSELKIQKTLFKGKGIILEASDSNSFSIQKISFICFLFAPFIVHLR